MSINAEFVAISPEELHEIIEDVDAVESLFMPVSPGSHRVLSIDKAWHGVHFLLTGDPQSTSGLGAVMLGGTEVGEDGGYGPARYFTSTEVAELAAALDAPGLDAEVAGRYDPGRMTDLSIYPGVWDEEDARDWLVGSIGDLRAFFHNAAANGDVIVTCLV